MADIVTFLQGLAELLAGVLPIALGLGATFTLLSALFTPCNPGLPWWRKPDLLLDIVYFFTLPLFGRIAMVVFLTVAIAGASAFGVLPAGGVIGTGPLSGLSFWPQLVVYLVLFDLMLYASHRAFHTAALWRYHATHHAPEHLDWISARRFHPVDVALHGTLPDFVLLMLGISPEVILVTAPFNVWHSALVHANLDWTFGPFRYVLAGPVFHRWHHTDVERGGSKNFAATFPIIDVIFGTFYMPKGALPDRYGVDDPAFPKTLVGQLAYPFAKPSRTAAEAPAPAADPGPQPA